MHNKNNISDETETKIDKNDVSHSIRYSSNIYQHNIEFKNLLILLESYKVDEVKVAKMYEHELNEFNSVHETDDAVKIEEEQTDDVKIYKSYEDIFNDDKIIIDVTNRLYKLLKNNYDKRYFILYKTIINDEAPIIKLHLLICKNIIDRVFRELFVTADLFHENIDDIFEFCFKIFGFIDSIKNINSRPSKKLSSYIVDNIKDDKEILNKLITYRSIKFHIHQNFVCGKSYIVKCYDKDLCQNIYDECQSYYDSKTLSNFEETNKKNKILSKNIYEWIHSDKLDLSFIDDDEIIYL